MLSQMIFSQQLFFAHFPCQALTHGVILAKNLLQILYSSLFKLLYVKKCHLYRYLVTNTQQKMVQKLTTIFTYLTFASASWKGWKNRTKMVYEAGTITIWVEDKVIQLEKLSRLFKILIDVKLNAVLKSQKVNQEIW
jgi:hypothetical protein